MRNMRAPMTFVISLLISTLTYAAPQSFLPVSERSRPDEGLSADAFLARESMAAGMVRRMNVLTSYRNQTLNDATRLRENLRAAFQVSALIGREGEVVVSETVIFPLGIVTLSIKEGRNAGPGILFKEEKTYEYDTSTGKVTWIINENDHEITRKEYRPGTDEWRGAIEDMIAGIQLVRNDIANTLDRGRLEEIKMRLVEVIRAQR